MLALLLAALLLNSATTIAQSSHYLWLENYSGYDTLSNRIPAPRGYVRIEAKDGSFADWIRHLPLKPGNPSIKLHNGLRAAFQDHHCAIVEIDVGSKDLQQCADAIIRFRAEYLYTIGKSRQIAFNFTSGDRADFYLWAEGYRPTVNGNTVSWQKSAPVDSSYRSLRAYIDIVFAYAGTYSLSKELQVVEKADDVEIGDILVLPGFPGHAVMVADVAANLQTGERVFLLIQGFSPAQDIHLLINESNPELSPWFSISSDTPVKVLWYEFTRDHLRRF
ncbi:MAG: DUF4846 domain-containing protein [candidate division Zixibacteria bacterium]|nr:DUF4846 domain-containing protein [candidate division Zixibacteria bacterium]